MATKKDRDDRLVLNEALNRMQGVEFDMMDFLLTKALVRHELQERGVI